LCHTPDGRLIALYPEGAPSYLLETSGVNFCLRWLQSLAEGTLFKAIDVRTQTEVVILDQRWVEDLDHLRSLGRQDFLICQECRHPVIVRAGDIRVWHFAHRHRGDCPYASESPVLLRTRASLYKWLLTKHRDHVQLEKRLEGGSLRHPVDCWVDLGEQQLAYWVFAATVGARRRDEIWNTLLSTKASVNWVFADELRQEAVPDSGRLPISESRPDHLHPTTTERHFISHSKYDDCIPGIAPHTGSSIHYLDAETNTLVTYRSLWLVHEPQLYAGLKRQSQMSSVLTLRSTGEFVHPGENELLKEYRKRQSKPRSNVGFGKAIVSAQTKAQQEPRAHPGDEWTSLTIEPRPEAAAQKEAVCKYCGATTTDYWFYDGATGMCICRKCRSPD